MRRVRHIALVLLLAAVGALGAAPATDERGAIVDHEVLLRPSSPFAHVAGGDVIAVNPTAFTELGDAPRCAKTPDAYCETMRIEVRHPPAAGERLGVADVTITLDARVVGADHDIHVYATDPDGGQRLNRIARSGNVAGCQLDCTAQSFVVNEDQQPCVGVDECVTFRLVTEPGVPVRYYLVDIVYFAATSGYEAELVLSVVDPDDR